MTAKLRSRRDVSTTNCTMDMYFSGDQMNRIWKRNRPECCQDHSWPTKGRHFARLDTFRVIKNGKGEYWCEWSSSRLCWVHRWYEMPVAVGKRAEEVYKTFEKEVK